MDFLIFWVAAAIVIEATRRFCLSKPARQSSLDSHNSGSHYLQLPKDDCKLSCCATKRAVEAKLREERRIAENNHSAAKREEAMNLPGMMEVYWKNLENTKNIVSSNDDRVPQERRGGSSGQGSTSGQTSQPISNIVASRVDVKGEVQKTSAKIYPDPT